MKRWVESRMVAYAPGQQGWCSDLDVWIQNLVLLLLLMSSLLAWLRLVRQALQWPHKDLLALSRG